MKKENRIRENCFWPGMNAIEKPRCTKKYISVDFLRPYSRSTSR